MILKFRSRQLIALVPGVILLLLSSCGGSDENSVVREARPAENLESVIPGPEKSQALISYLTGDVTLADTEGERDAEIGDSVGLGTRISTGVDGYAELQFGNLAALRIDSSTIYVIETLSLGEERGQVKANLESGSLAAKVRKLSGDDRFEVNVSGAVCAVRGTEFIVRAGKSGSVTIAVAEGSVAVNPPSLSNLERDNPDDDVIMSIRSLMPLVSSSQELTLQADDLSRAQNVLAVWESGTRDEPEQLDLQIREALKELPAPSDLSDINASRLKESVPRILPMPSVSSTNQAEALQLASLTVTVLPVDSAIYINDRREGSGTVSRVFGQGSSVLISAVSPGGQRLERRVVAGREERVVLEFQEEAEVPDVPKQLSTGLSTVVEKSPASPAPQVSSAERPSDKPALLSRQALPEGGRAVGALVSGPNQVVGATSNGLLYSVTANGAIAWTFQTNNSDAENTTAFIEGGRVYTIGNKELVVLDLSNGRLITRVPLVGDQSDLYGRRPLIWQENLVLPSDSSLEFLDPASGEVRQSMVIPEGSRMTPVTWQSLIVIADQRGSLLLIDPETKTISDTITTGAVQPVAQAIAISRDAVAVFSGRRGMVSAVDLEERRVLWERNLSKDKRVSVFTDPVIDGNTVYLYGEQTLYSLNLRNGTDKMAPITDVSAPPVVIDGKVYLTTNTGTLKLINSSDGSSMGELLLGEKIVSTPVVLGANIVLAGEHNLFVVDPSRIGAR